MSRRLSTVVLSLVLIGGGVGVGAVSTASASTQDPPTNCVVNGQPDQDCDGTVDFFDQCPEDVGPSEFTDPTRPNGGCPDGRPFTPPAPQNPNPSPSPTPTPTPTQEPEPTEDPSPTIEPSPTQEPSPTDEPEPTFVIDSFNATALTCRRGTSLVSYFLNEEAAMRVKYGQGKWQRLGEKRVGKHQFRTRFMVKYPRRNNVSVVRLQANPLSHDAVVQDTDTVAFVLKRPSRRMCRQ